MKIGLVTGGRWHKEPFLYLKRKKYEIILFDDSSNCFLSNQYNLIPNKINKMKEFNNI